MKPGMLGMLLLAGLLLPAPAVPQTTDGYHSLQILPVVVDTASFAQRFNFTNPNASAISLRPRYFPGNGTAQAGTPLTCPDIAVPANSAVTIASLRTMCPALVAGSAFGLLHISENSSAHLPFAAFSRVANPQGNGFTVEAFPAHTFTSAETVVNGIRRLAAAGGAPSFQTNCFAAVINELSPPGAATAKTITYKVYNAAGNQVGTGSESLLPGEFVRLLDIFAAAGAPAGDYNDASVRFSAAAGTALATFCTVQDNTSFGADFRIGKQVLGAGSQYPSIGAMDDHVSRNSTVSADMYTEAEGSARLFSLQDTVSRNLHVLYFRHPDWVSCEIIDTATGVRALQAYGLELRLFDPSGTLIAGGSLVTGFSGLYLGDKRARNASANTRYALEIRGNGTLFSNRRYNLHCSSGSGHTMGDMIRAGLPLPFTTEAEPNNTTVQADANAVRFGANPLLSGSISPTGDVDQTRGDIASVPAVVRFEIFSPAGTDCGSGQTTTLRLRNGAGSQITLDANSSGIGPCSALVFPFETAGTYYVQVEETGNDATVSSYTLETRLLTNRGTESETPGASGANDTPATASTLFGNATEGFVSGDHMLDSDVDVYAIVVPAGKALRAEIVEGARATKTCESDMKPSLTLLASDGATPLAAGVSGRGLCPLIDGTGASPVNAAAKNNTANAVTWYLRISTGSIAFNGEWQFKYRLAITIR